MAVRTAPIIVGTCHGMSPEAMLMRGVALADMPWHVPTMMRTFLKFVACPYDKITASEQHAFCNTINDL